jgi:hypothetical protein
MTAAVRTAIFLTPRAAPTAAAIDDDIFLTLPVAVPSGIESADVNVFLTVDFARRMIGELESAIEAAIHADL